MYILYESLIIVFYLYVISHYFHSYNRNRAPLVNRLSRDHVAYHTDRKLQPHPYHRAHTYKCTRCICIFSYIYPIYPICSYTDLALVLSSCHTVNAHSHKNSESETPVPLAPYRRNNLMSVGFR